MHQCVCQHQQGREGDTAALCDSRCQGGHLQLTALPLLSAAGAPPCAPHSAWPQSSPHIKSWVMQSVSIDPIDTSVENCSVSACISHQKEYTARWRLLRHVLSWTLSQMAGGGYGLPVGATKKRHLIEDVYLGRAHRWHCIASSLHSGPDRNLWLETQAMHKLEVPVWWAVLITKPTVNSSNLQEHTVPRKIGFCPLVKAQWSHWQETVHLRKGGWQ